MFILQIVQDWDQVTIISHKQVSRSKSQVESQVEWVESWVKSKSWVEKIYINTQAITCLLRLQHILIM